MKRPDHAIDAYLEGQLTGAQARALEAWINDDPANAADFLHLARTHQTLGVIGKEQRLARAANDANHEDLDPVTLHALAEMEAAAEPVPLREIARPIAFDEIEPKQKPQKSADLAHAIDDLRWAAGKAATKLIRSPYGITSTIAALLILGLYLFVPFSSAPAPPQDIADNPATESQQPTEPAPPILRDQPVATLTATHNAAWAEGAVAPGSSLQPGTRLTLTAGFAEITTARGAIALIEAPATVEFVDNNTLKLTTGRISADVPPAATGFTINAPGVTLIDLGTSFGVHVKDTQGTRQTDAFVYDGEVIAKPAQANSPSHSMIAGEGVRTVVTASGDTEVQVNPQDNLAQINCVRPLTATNTGLVELRGNVAWQKTPPPTVVTSKNERSHEAILFAERRSLDVRALAQVKIDRAATGTPVIDFRPTAPETNLGRAMPQGNIDVYLLHFDPVGDEVEDEAYFDATMTFEGEIVGVIYQGPSLIASDAALGSPAVTYDQFTNRGLDKDDIVEISPDRRTVRVRAGAAMTDQARILVRSNPQPD